VKVTEGVEITVPAIGAAKTGLGTKRWTADVTRAGLALAEARSAGTSWTGCATGARWVETAEWVAGLSFTCVAVELATADPAFFSMDEAGWGLGGCELGAATGPDCR
jgi:hypothetical protein